MQACILNAHGNIKTVHREWRKAIPNGQAFRTCVLDRLEENFFVLEEPIENALGRQATHRRTAV